MEALNDTNVTDICVFTSGSPLPTWLIVFQTIFLVLVLLLTLFLNVSFTIVVIIHKELHQKEMMINLVLTASNICTVVIGNIPNIAAVINGGWPFGKPFCYAIGTVIYFLVLLRYTFILAITVDRFGAVMYPFQYPQHSTKVVAAIFTVGCLFGAVSSLVLDANIAGCYNFDQSAQVCTFLYDCSEVWCYVYVTFQILTVASFGIVAPLILNILMFHKAKKLRSTVACGTIGNVQMVAPYGSTDKRSSQLQDMRAMVTVALLLASIVALTQPYFTFFSAKSILNFDVATDSPASLVAILLGDVYILIPVADTLVVWRNTEVKERALSLCKRMYKVFKTSTED